MNKDEYLRQYEIGESYWWFVARRNVILDILKRLFPKERNCNIIDIGCGPGNMLSYLSKFGPTYGLDTSEEAIELCKKRGYDAVKKGDIERIDYPNETFDAVLGLDVLEHCVNDVSALKEVFRICKIGGYCIFTVPAYQFLWTEHDSALHHKRRYVREELMAKFKKENFLLIKTSYFNTLLFPLQFYFRIFKKISMSFISNRKTSSNTDFIYSIHPFVNKILKVIFEFEKYILRILDMPFGLSLICIARKRVST